MRDRASKEQNNNFKDVRCLLLQGSNGLSPNYSLTQNAKMNYIVRLKKGFKSFKKEQVSNRCMPGLTMALSFLFGAAKRVEWKLQNL